MAKKLVIISFSIGLLLTAPRFGFAQAAESQQTAQDAVKSGEAKSSPADIQWIWGEVVSVNAAGKSLSVKYLDYDTDEEKTMELSTMDTTKFQDVKGLEGIKSQDTISIEYVVTDGKNYAKDITVEQVEDAGTENSQPQTALPEKVGSGPVTETEGPVAPPDQTQSQQQGQ